MSATIDIAIESERWAKIPAAADTVRRALETALAECRVLNAEVSVMLADDTRIRDLNRTWRGHDQPTNVLSFPAPEGPPDDGRFLGDIVLAFETVEQEACAEGKPIEHHLAHLAVHGTLHLLGYDHERDSDADAMEQRERLILARLGIPDPYASAEARRTEPA